MSGERGGQDHPHLKQIVSSGHGYKTHHAGRPKRHSLYVVVHHPARNMLYPHSLLPE